jgi:hypothetical protein
VRYTEFSLFSNSFWGQKFTKCFQSYGILTLFCHVTVAQFSSKALLNLGLTNYVANNGF